MKKVLVLGGGFAGVNTAIQLKKLHEASVTLISDKSWHDYKARAFKVLEDGDTSSIYIPLADLVGENHFIVDAVQAIDLEKLCVESGKLVFVVFIDVYVLNHDGNLIDASAIAALAALINTKMFKYTVEEGEIVKKPGYTPLPVVNYPVAVTFAKIGDKLILDTGLDEEEVMDARLTMTMDKNGNICAIQKGGGSGYFTKDEIIEATKIASEKTEEIRKIVVKN